MRLQTKLIENKLPSRLLSSKIVIKILEELVIDGPQTRTSLARKTGSRYSKLVEYLDCLINFGIVKEIKGGGARIYLINEENPRSKIIKNFILSWISLNDEIPHGC